MKFRIAGLLFLLTCFYLQAQADKEQSKFDHTFEVDLETELKYFYNEASFENQEEFFPSFAIRPKYTLEWDDGYQSFNFEGFLRIDKDKKRTHVDVRELYYFLARDNWELSAGIKKVFWGVTESNHLVDIINQTDAVESFDGEQKLGQPMLQYSLNTNFGTFDIFYLPYHRKRTFAGEKGRFRFPLVIDKDDLGYESSAKEWHQDFAIRYSHSFSVIDVGLSHFYGTGREPLIQFSDQGELNAFYPIINQTGLDLQVTHNAFLWKLESIYRTNDYQDFFALTAGVEFTISNIKSTGIDVGLLGEYLYDERDELALTAMQKDIFYGSRIAFNDVQDTSLLIGGILDLDTDSHILSLEASRRLGSSWKLELEGRFLNGINDDEVYISNFKRDSFVRFNLIKYL